jgi:acyl-CoA thioesterase I
VPSVLVLLSSLAAASCGGGCEFGYGVERERQNPEVTVTAQRLPGGTTSRPFKIVFLGDSLTAGLGLLSEEAYPALIGKKFADEGYSNVEIVNAGVSGDTTAGGLRRLPEALDSDTKILVVALGGNDALRALTTTQTYENLSQIVAKAQATGSWVLFAGMEAPPNLGEDYQQNFRAAFIRVAREHRTNLVYMPFLLEGVAGDAALNQPDGIHPNKEGARIIAENMYPKLRTIVDEIGGGG